MMFSFILFISRPPENIPRATAGMLITPKQKESLALDLEVEQGRGKKNGRSFDLHHIKTYDGVRVRTCALICCLPPIPSARPLIKHSLSSAPGLAWCMQPPALGLVWCFVSVCVRTLLSAPSASLKISLSTLINLQ